MIEDKDHRTIARHIFQPGDLDAAEVNPESKSQEATDNSPDHVWYGTACGSKRVLLVNAVYALTDGSSYCPISPAPTPSENPCRFPWYAQSPNVHTNEQP